MLNHITVMGRLTRDPELRYTQTQTPVTSFRVAVDRDYAPKDGGERQTDFIDCVAWRSTAEFVSKYFQKGSMAVVSGRLQMRDWTDRDGNKRTSAEIVADNVYFGESKRSRDESGGGYNGGGYNNNSGGGYSGGGYSGGYSGNGGGYNRQSAPAPAPAPSAGAFSDLSGDDDGDLPF